MVKFDEVLEKIGEFGPFQKRIFVLVSMVTVVSSLLAMSPVFLLDIPNHSIGRKKSLILSLPLTVATSVAAAFAPNYEIYVAIAFLNNLAGAALFMIPFVIVMEVVGPSKRTFVGASIQFFWVLEMIMLNAAAYFIRQWRHLHLVIGAPPIMFLVYWWIIPESPRWLISKGRTEEASKILRKMAESNKVELEEEVMKNVTVEKEEKTVHVWKMFTSPVLLLRNFVILFNWIVVMLTYAGLTLNVGNLGGSIYLNFFWSSLVELLAYVGCYFLLTKLGRKTILCVSHLFGGVACLASIFPVVYRHDSLIVVALSMVGRIGSSSATSVIYIFTAELLPTVVRQSGIGLCTVCQILGTMVAPYVSDLGILVKGSMAEALPLIVFGSLTVTAGLLCLLLPETKDELLPETIEDSINFKTGKKGKA